MRMRSAVASLTAHTKPKFCDKWPCQRWPWGWGWGAPGARTRGGSRPANIEEEAPPLPRSPAPLPPRARATYLPGHRPRPPDAAPIASHHRAPRGRAQSRCTGSAGAAQGQRRGRTGAGQVQDRCRAAELHTPPPHPLPGPPPPSSPSRVAHGASRHLLLFEDTLVDALAELAEVLAHHRERDRLGQLPGWGWGRCWGRVRVRRALHLPARSVACVCVARRHRGHGWCGCDLLPGHRPATEPAPLRHPLRRAVSHPVRPVSQAGAMARRGWVCPSGRAAARRGPGRGACTVGCSGRSRSSPRPGARARPRARKGAAY